MSRNAFLTIVLCVATLHTHAAQNCDAIVAHGLLNVAKSQSEGASVALRYFNHCQKDFSRMEDSRLAEAEVEVFGYGAGDGSYSRTRREERLLQWCTTNHAVATANASSYHESRTFYQGAVSAWESCNRLGSKDIIITPEISGDRLTVDIGIVYRGPTEGILLSGVETEGFDCKLRAPTSTDDVVFPVRVTSQAYHLRCLRNQPQARTLGGEVFEVVPRGTIAIQTASDPFQLFFVEEWSPSIPRAAADALKASISRSELPVGTVISSVVAPERFLSEMNPQFQAGKWVLADGSRLPENSAYERLTGQDSAPDYQYLRDSEVVTNIVVGTLSHGENVVSFQESMVPSDPRRWRWMSAARISQGRAVNNDWEQDSDKFENYITEDGVVISQGSTYNRKHVRWGDWNPGQATILGLATRTLGLYHYVKIN